MFTVLFPALRASLLLWALLGLVYPLAVTGLGQALFRYEAQGSLLRSAEGAVIGSRLIGQQWTGPEWFHGRPSATTAADPADPTKTIAAPYNAANSGGSNLGPTSAVLVERLAADRKVLDQAEPGLAGKPIPADMLTTSGSGLDPEISPAYAALQVRRVAAARGLPKEHISALLAGHIVGRTFGIFGEPRVNVLELNLDLQNMYPSNRPRD
ncbi:MAG: potassium-transporting ATPase subunit KdpC [Alphaproteobacteria bacterium]|nr:potassium-transporting ATPase subunit KdpC [Alphaproteobacteria bacterium]